MLFPLHGEARQKGRVCLVINRFATTTEDIKIEPTEEWDRNAAILNLNVGRGGSRHFSFFYIYLFLWKSQNGATVPNKLRQTSRLTIGLTSNILFNYPGPSLI